MMKVFQMSYNSWSILEGDAGNGANRLISCRVIISMNQTSSMCTVQQKSRDFVSAQF